MPTKRSTEVFAEPISDEDEVIATPAPQGSDVKRARIKGTWTMYWGTLRFDFQDGKTFNIPQDLYNYLRANGNIYDTL